ncbi:MAG: D-2-hydroxyacid dehydrogenase [Xanthobacteraceae bacterium]
MTSVLILLGSSNRNQYGDGLRKTFPELTVNVIDHVGKADPYVSTVDILITHGPYLADQADHLLRNAPKLKWIQGVGTGVDNITDRPALRDDIIVTNIHGVHGPQMSEAALMAMLALSRQFPRTVQNQARRHWERWPARLISGKTVGVLGVGAIAASLAPRCKAMGMRVIGISSAVRQVAGFDEIRPRKDILAAVRELDYLVVLTPYSPATLNLVDGEVLGAMKPDSYLINLARGGVVDEAALLDKLRKRGIAGAALDVFVNEPLPTGHPFWSMDNVIVTCHQGSLHDGSSRQNLPIIEENMRRFLAGDTANMLNVVRPAPAPA